MVALKVMVGIVVVAKVGMGVMVGIVIANVGNGGMVKFGDIVMGMVKVGALVAVEGRVKQCWRAVIIVLSLANTSLRTLSGSGSSAW